MAKLQANVEIQVVREGRFMNAYQSGVEVTKHVPQPIRRKALNKGASLMIVDGEFQLVKPGAARKAAPAAPKVEAPVLEPTMDLKVADIENPELQP